MLGPYIPAERKMVLKQILQKVSSVWKEKKSTKSDILQEWRLARLAEKIRMLRDENRGFFLLCKVFDKRTNSFYKIQDFGNVRQEKIVSEGLRNQINLRGNDNSEAKEALEKLQRENEEMRKEIAQLKSQNAELLKGSGESAEMTKQIQELKKLLSDRDSEVTKLKSSNLSNSDENLNISKQKADLEKQLSTMRDQISRYEKEIESLSNVEMSNGTPRVIHDHTATNRVVTKTIQPPQNTKVQVEQIGTIITDLKKSRIIDRMFKSLEAKRMANTFNNILKSGIHSKRAWGSASSRMKGRVLQLLRQKYASNWGAQKAFLRWWVAVHPTFQRDCITKVALNARITHQSAVWRFRKMVIKNVKVKLPEAVRKVRYTSGLYLLDAISRADRISKLVEGFNNMRPGIDKRLKKLVKLLTNKAIQEETIKTQALNKLRHHNKATKDIMRNILNNLENKLKDAFHKLVENGLSAGPKGLSDEEKQKRLFNKLGRAGNEKARDALQQMRVNRTVTILDEKETTINREITKIIRQKKSSNMANLLRNGLGGQVKNALDSLRKNKEDREKEENDKHKKLKNLLDKIKGASEAKRKETLNNLQKEALAENLKDVLEKDRRSLNDKIRDKVIKQLLNRIRNGEQEKARNALDNLREFNRNQANLDADTARKMRNIVKNLTKNVFGKKGQAFNNLRNNCQEEREKEMIEQLQDRLRKMKENNAIKRLIDKARGGNMTKLLEAMEKLREFNNDEKHKELENQLKVKNVMDKIQGIGNDLFKEDRIYCYKKMVEYAKDLKKGSNQKTKVLNAIKNGSMSKLKDAIHQLRQHNLYENAQRQLDQTIIDIKMDREMNLQRKLFNRLMNAQRIKCNSAFKLLEYANNLAKDNENKGRRLAENLMNRAKQNLALCRAEAMRKLEAYAKKNEMYDKKFKNALTRLVNRAEHNNKSIEGQVLNRLKDNKHEMALKDSEQASKLRHFINKMLTGRTGQELSALNKLRANNQEVARNEEIQRTYIRRLVNRMGGTMEKQKEEALRNLRNHNKDEKQREKDLHDATKRLVNKIRDANNMKTNQAFDNLCNMIKNVGPAFDQREFSAKRIANEMLKGKNSKLQDALNKLRNHNLEEKNKDEKQKRLLEKVVDKMMNGNDHLAQQAVDKFRNFLKTIKNEERYETIKKSNIIRYLNKGMGTQLGRAMDQLRRHNQDLANKENRDDRLKNKIINKMLNGNVGQMNEALNKLKNHSMSKEGQAVREKILKNNLLKKLLENTRGKTGGAVNNLRDFAKGEADNEAKRSRLINRLAKNLLTNQNRKADDALSKLIKNKVINDLEETKRNIIRKNAARLFRNKLLDRFREETSNSLNKLVTNTLNRRVINERTKKLVSDMRHTQKTKITKVVYEMKLNNLTQAVKNAERREKLNHILSRAYRRYLKTGYSGLIKNAFMKQRFSNVLKRAEINTVRTLKKTYLERMRELVRNRGEKVGRFVDTVSSVFRMRRKHAFSEMYVKYEIYKREKISKGLLNTEHFMSRHIYKRREEHFAIIKKLFFNENPWERHAIKKFTIMTSCSAQVAFWKIKLQKNIGSGNVSANTSIRLKAFVEAFEKKRARVLQGSFARIDVTRTGDSMNVSFLSPKIPLGKQQSIKSSRNY